MQHADKLETLPIDSLVPYARNARTHSPEQVAAVARSIQRFGFTNPVLIDAEGGIVAGHGRVMAAKSIGMGVVPCLRVGWLTEAEKRAYVLADNKLAELAGWDDELLAGELRALQADDFDLSLTGFAQDELDDLLIDKTEGKTDPDAVPPAPTIPVTQPGDVWVLGRHRIICGDALKRDTYAALLKGERAGLLVTDPPYGVAYHDSKKGGASSSISGDLTQAAIPVGFSLALENMSENANCYLFGGAANFPMYSALFDHYLRMQPRLCVWIKESFVLRQLGYHSQFEQIYWGWKGNGGKSDYWHGDRKQSDVWQVRRDHAKDREHPTQKPVDVYRIPISNSAPPGGIVLEPFSGSGVCIIACEATGRTCRAIELSPQYVDVAVRRWQQFTGLRAVRESDGLEFPA